MKGIVNILIVILITYTLNAIPVNNTLLSFDLIKPWDIIASEDSSDTETEDIPALTIEFIDHDVHEFNNPESMDIEFISNSKLNKATLSTIKDQLTIPDTLKTNDLKLLDEKDGAWHYGLMLNVSSQDTGHFIGSYTLTLDLENSSYEVLNPTTYTLNYLPKVNYTSAIAEASKDQIYTQVYYLNKSKEFLVPVTKKLPSSSKFIRNTISSLSYEPPSNDQIFAQDVVFPKMPKVYLHNGVLSCYLSGSEVSKFESGTTANRLISEAIVKTLTDIGYVNNLAFYVNDRQNGNFINGLPLKTIYNEDYTTYAFINYMDKKGNSYLVPKAIEDGQDTVEDIFNILQSYYEIIGEYGTLTATVPNTVKIVDYTVNGSELQIVFSDDLFAFSSDDTQLKDLMMDSLIQSFTSLPSIDTVIISTESHHSGKIGNVSLGESLKSNRFLNPMH